MQHTAVHTNSRPHLRRIGKWAGRTQRKTKGTCLGVGVRAGAREEVEAGAGAEVEAEGARPAPREESKAREREDAPPSILLTFVAQEHNETRRHRTGATPRATSTRATGILCGSIHCPRTRAECILFLMCAPSHLAGVDLADFFYRVPHHTTVLSGTAADYSRAVSCTRQVPFLAPESAWRIFYYFFVTTTNN